jgi:hypothetical protein
MKDGRIINQIFSKILSSPQRGETLVGKNIPPNIPELQRSETKYFVFPILFYNFHTTISGSDDAKYIYSTLCANCVLS